MFANSCKTMKDKFVLFLERMRSGNQHEALPCAKFAPTAPLLFTRPLIHNFLSERLSLLLASEPDRFLC